METQYDDDALLEAAGLPIAAQRARSLSLRGQRPVSMPSTGIETPPPQPGASPNAAPGDYRSQALALMKQASEAAPGEADINGVREFAKQRDEKARRDFALGLTMSTLGGESMSPVGGQVLKSALAAQEPMKFAGGVIERGEFTADPETGAQRRALRLESQAKIYESMAQHAESVEQRRAASQAAADLRREIANATASRSQERGEEQRAARSFTQENTLRDDFEKQVKDQRVSIATYPQLEAALTAKTPSAAGDMRAIFRYMKMLDPTSVVREGEFATARNAAGIPERVLNLYNKALSGQLLSPEQRQDFLGQARSERDTAMKFFNERAAVAERVARSYGLDPRKVILGYDGGDGATSAPGAGGAGWGIVR